MDVSWGTLIMENVYSLDTEFLTTFMAFIFEKMRRCSITTFVEMIIMKIYETITCSASNTILGGADL